MNYVANEIHFVCSKKGVELRLYSSWANGWAVVMYTFIQVLELWVTN